MMKVLAAFVVGALLAMPGVECSRAQLTLVTPTSESFLSCEKLCFKQSPGVCAKKYAVAGSKFSKEVQSEVLEFCAKLCKPSGDGMECTEVSAEVSKPPQTGGSSKALSRLPNGGMSMQNTLQNGHPLSKTPHQADREAKLLKKVFDAIGKNSNGRLTRAKIITALRRKDKSLARMLQLPTNIRQEDGSRDQFERVFQAMDVDNNKEIDWNEFRNYVIGSPPQRTLRAVTAIQQGLDPAAPVDVAGVRGIANVQKAIQWQSKSGELPVALKDTDVKDPSGGRKAAATSAIFDVIKKCGGTEIAKDRDSCCLKHCFAVKNFGGLVRAKCIKNCVRA